MTTTATDLHGTSSPKGSKDSSLKVGPFQRPVTPRQAKQLSSSLGAPLSHAASLTAHLVPASLESGLTMWGRAKRVAAKVAPQDAGSSDEYVSAFGPSKELSRTPKRGVP
jgi:hypothetical protein